MSLADLATAALRTADPETAHRLALRALRSGAGPRAPRDDPRLAVRLAGLQLPNPVGLAAGFDKDAEAPDALLKAGFGFVECGTVTPLPQEGNARPRLFRLTADRAVINRMGFNNRGLEAFAARLEGRPRRGILGANLGANKDSPDRIGDYAAGLKRLSGLCDYFTINVSSPNTPGLRDLQGAAALEALLERVSGARSGPQPLFLKVAPDLEPAQIPDIVAAVRRFGIDGLVVSNTTTARPPSLSSKLREEAGGLSGAPLFAPSTALLRRFRELDPDLPLIGVGGVSCGAQALEKLRAGATAVQLYSALVFEGPGLVARIKRELLEALGPSAASVREAPSGAGGSSARKTFA